MTLGLDILKANPIPYWKCYLWPVLLHLQDSITLLSQVFDHLTGQHNPKESYSFIRQAIYLIDNPKSICMQVINVSHKVMGVTIYLKTVFTIFTR
jgi:hypothetical protein